MSAKVRAPELVGSGGWINTGGKELSLRDFRGRFLLIDHWTLCCANCLHVLDELRPLEAKYSSVLTVVGAHAPKFKHEADHDALVAACSRYSVEHPVLDDPELVTWKAYAVKAWPTLSLVDPEGYLVAQFSGEGHVHAIDRLLEQLVEEHRAKGTLVDGSGFYVPPVESETVLRFPSKVVRLESGNFLVADSGHNCLTEVDSSFSFVRSLGVGEFAEPNGLCLLPSSVAAAVGYQVVVADTVNHRLCGLDLESGSVRELCKSDRLMSPWDVVWFEGKIVVAGAGVHQLFYFDPLIGDFGVWAGTSNEGLVDGPLESAWFAQTSGLAVSADGSTLWIADSETSSLRSISGGVVRTHVGKGLFDFGHVDGPASSALFQHPLGVTVLPDGSVAVLDTYNGAVRRYSPAEDSVSTLITGLGEPSGALVMSDGTLLVVESTEHRLSLVRLPEEALVIAGEAQRTQRPVTEIASGTFEISVVFTPPPGQKLDERYGPSTRLLISSTPPALLKSGEGKSESLTRVVEIDGSVGSGVLHVAASAASCDTDAEFPACHVHQQDWGIPVVITDNAPAVLRLPLGG